ncbi:MAG: VOC family protein [Actinobacteria bacterium]|nr:VOC family protein [Actinomycetota bacterium]MBU1943111.1 VOC family protein [Actinomycetota bacterium]MBU2687942.1 VOC family protein [Actinomycetota bacterium]
MKSKAGALKVPRLGQVGIVVRNVDAAVAYFSDVFGLGPWAVFEGTPERCTDRGREVTFTGRMAMAQAGGVQVELIQILGDEKTTHTEFLERHGEGIHHVGFFVNNLDERLAAARRAGIDVLQHGLLKRLGLSIEYAYLDTVETGGVIIEYIQPRYLGLPFPMRFSPLLRLSARLSRMLPGG